MRQFVPVDFYDEDSEYVHVNPNIIAYTKIVKTEGESFAKEFPWTVEAYMINHEIIAYYFKTKQEAKAFTHKIGGTA